MTLQIRKPIRKFRDYCSCSNWSYLFLLKNHRKKYWYLVFVMKLKLSYWYLKDQCHRTRILSSHDGTCLGIVVKRLKLYIYARTIIMFNHQHRVFPHIGRHRKYVKQPVFSSLTSLIIALLFEDTRSVAEDSFRLSILFRTFSR